MQGHCVGKKAWHKCSEETCSPTLGHSGKFSARQKARRACWPSGGNPKRNKTDGDCGRARPQKNIRGHEASARSAELSAVIQAGFFKSWDSYRPSGLGTVHQIRMFTSTMRKAGTHGQPMTSITHRDQGRVRGSALKTLSAIDGVLSLAPTYDRAIAREVLGI